MALTAKKVYAILKRQISDMEAKLNSPVRYRGTVATADLLPLNPDIGDMYNIESKSIYGEAGMNVAWNGVVWDTMGAPIDMSLYLTKEGADTTIQNMVNEYLEKNPVKPGATTEQAQQIEQNKTDIGLLKTETNSLKEDLDDFKDSNFSCKKQYIKKSSIIEDSIYYTNSSTHSNGGYPGYKCYPKIAIEKGKTYRLANVYETFTNIEYDNDTAFRIGDGDRTVDYIFTASDNGIICITADANKSDVYMVDGIELPSEYLEGYFDYTIKKDTLGRQVGATNCDFFIDLIQLLKKDSNHQNGYWENWSGSNFLVNANDKCYAYDKIRLSKGITYYFKNVYAYFCLFGDDSGNKIGRLSTKENAIDGIYTPTEDCWVYITIFNDQYGIAMILNNNKIIPSEYVEGVYACVLDSYVNTDNTLSVEGKCADAKAVGDRFGIDITVKKDGSGDYTSVIDAFDYANNLSNGIREINVYIYEGEYDLFEELGGDTWLTTIDSEVGEHCGLYPKDKVNLYGIGNVILKLYLPDTATLTETTKASCLNLYYSNRIENITFKAKNCRYTCHDEADGGNKNITRYVKNCRFIHFGNKSGMWLYPTVMGGGATGGSSYDWINCQFITNVYGQAFSYHTNSEMKPSHFNIDGCVGICNSEKGVSFRAGYYGTNHVGKTIFNFKNCTGNGMIVKNAETSESVDHIEMYNNGYVQITDVSPYVDAE